MRVYLILCSLFLISHLNAQFCIESQSSAYISANDIHARVNNNGSNFTDGSNGQFLTDSLNSTFFTTGLWMGGYDDGGNLLGAARLYGQSGFDYTSGPIDPANGTTDSLSCSQYDVVWKVERSVIEQLIGDYNDDGVVQNPDSSLLTWPGRNNPHFSGIMGFQLPLNEEMAPFYDYNNDGSYNPYDGDYPVYENGNSAAIASEVLWTIYNDNGSLHTESTMIPLRMEIHQTIYAFSCPNDPILNRTIFSKHKLVNRNVISIRDFRAGFFLDFDIGNYADDYVGSDSLLNAVFAYNGDDFDNPTFWATGYAEKPPVQSVILLNQPIYQAQFFMNSPSQNPSTGIDFYNLLDGVNPSTGSSYGYDFAFSDPPKDTSSTAFNMGNAGMSPDDMRMLISIKKDSLLAGEIQEFDMAYVYHRDTSLADHLAMTDLVYTELPEVQNWYDQGLPTTCYPSISLGLYQLIDEVRSFRLWPNPSSGSFQIELPQSMTDYQLKLFSMTGQVVHQQALIGDQQLRIELQQLPAGSYIVQLEASNGTRYQQKLILQP